MTSSIISSAGGNSDVAPAQLMSLGEATHESRREALVATFSLRTSHRGHRWARYRLLPFIRDGRTRNISRRARGLRSSRHRGRPFASKCVGAARAIGRIDRPEPATEGAWGCDFFMTRNGEFLPLATKWAERRIDSSFYDLLASEARLRAFLASRAESAVEHWWA